MIALRIFWALYLLMLLVIDSGNSANQLYFLRRREPVIGRSILRLGRYTESKITSYINQADKVNLYSCELQNGCLMQPEDNNKSNLTIYPYLVNSSKSPPVNSPSKPSIFI